MAADDDAPRTVAIIGGGPSGMGVARALAPERLVVHVFDRQPAHGGVWRYTGNGPMYRELDTNVTIDLMAYKDRPFPPSDSEFVDRDVVRQYLADYADEVAAAPNVHVHLGTAVPEVTKHGSKWQVATARGQVFETDYLVVASGHYAYPLWPPIDDIPMHVNWLIHSHDYDTPEPFVDKRVLVVGNGASGLDIAVQLLRVTGDVIIARRHEAPATDSILEKHVTFRGEVASIHPHTRVATYRDGTAERVDQVIICTGYRYAYPFLDKHAAKLAEAAPALPLFDAKAQRLHNLWQETVFIGDPTLAFICMNKQIVPFPLSECQGALLAALWAGTAALPPIADALAAEAEKERERGTDAKFENLGYPRDADFMDTLGELAAAGGAKFVPLSWDAKLRDKRQHVGELKLAQFADKVRRNVEERKRRRK